MTWSVIVVFVSLYPLTLAGYRPCKPLTMGTVRCPASTHTSCCSHGERYPVGFV